MGGKEERTCSLGVNKPMCRGIYCIKGEESNNMSGWFNGKVIKIGNLGLYLCWGPPEIRTPINIST